MASTPLHYAARVGDAALCVYLIEVEGADVNAYDEWQCQPLFYACLCGHEDVLRLLLRAGAACERNTWDGERCLYACLNAACRSTLQREGFVLGSVRADDAWLYMLECAHDSIDDERFVPHRDFAVLTAGGQRVCCHASLLAARCPVLAARFFTSGEAEADLSRARAPPELLAGLIRWCYTDRFACAATQAEPAARLLSQAGLPELRDALRDAAAAQPPPVQAGRRPPQPPSAGRLVVEPTRMQCKAAMRAALSQLRDAASESEGEEAEEAEGRAARRARRAATPPARLAALRRGALRVRLSPSATFRVHGWLLAPRSDVWLAQLSRWRAGPAASLDLALPDISPPAFRALLDWLYLDALPPGLPPPLLLQVVAAADALLIEPLKQRAAAALVPAVALPRQAVPLLGFAEEKGCARLAAAAAAQVALELESLAGDAELAACVAESAARIRGRQAADSIPVLDEVALHVKRLHGAGGELSDEEEEERWAALPERCAAEREAKARAMAARGGSERRRKAALLQILAARVQGWEVAGARTA